ncbi:hypothetical protein GGQ58_003012 [Paracoccus denitrificans]|nr:hypothetical protein [Paracoccus denitrificans]
MHVARGSFSSSRRARASMLPPARSVARRWESPLRINPAALGQDCVA